MSTSTSTTETRPAAQTDEPRQAGCCGGHEKSAAAEEPDGCCGEHGHDDAHGGHTARGGHSAAA